MTQHLVMDFILMDVIYQIAQKKKLDKLILENI